MSLVHDRGFRRRVEFALFSVAKDKAPTAAGNDLAFINGILNGEHNITAIATGVVVAQNAPETADDAALKTTITAIWNFYAAAWVARTV